MELLNSRSIQHMLEPIPSTKEMSKTLTASAAFISMMNEMFIIQDRLKLN